MISRCEYLPAQSRTRFKLKPDRSPALVSLFQDLGQEYVTPSAPMWVPEAIIVCATALHKQGQSRWRRRRRGETRYRTYQRAPRERFQRASQCACQHALLAAPTLRSVWRTPTPLPQQSQVKCFASSSPSSTRDGELHRSRDLRLRMTFWPRTGNDYFILRRDGGKGGSSV